MHSGTFNTDLYMTVFCYLIEMAFRVEQLAVLILISVCETETYQGLKDQTIYMCFLICYNPHILNI